MRKEMPAKYPNHKIVEKSHQTHGTNLAERRTKGVYEIVEFRERIKIQG